MAVSAAEATVSPVPTLWLWVYRAVTLILLVFSFLLAIDSPWTFDCIDFAIPLLIVLWSSRSNPPGSSGALVAIVTALAIVGVMIIFKWWQEFYLGFALAMAVVVITNLIVTIRVGLQLCAGPNLWKRIRGGAFFVAVYLPLAVAFFVLPGMLAREGSPNEASAVGSVRTINTAEVTYASTYPEIGFCSLASLGGEGGKPTSAGIIDNVLASGEKSGYRFAVTVGKEVPAKTYVVTAEPVEFPRTGQRAFCSDQTGVIRYSTNGKAATCLASGVALQ